MRILAIDPGPTESAFVELVGSQEITDKGKLPNLQLLGKLYNVGLSHEPSMLAVEMIASYGMPVGREVFETVFWAGRFVEAWPLDFTLVYRGEVKMHLCRSMRAKDANIRQALIDRFGGPSAIGRKASPGPLYGISGDIWSALAVAVYYHDKYVVSPDNPPFVSC